MRTAPILVSLVAGLAVAGCDAQQAAPAEGGGAAGEVLGGSISDDMLPIEQLRSQPPQAEIVPEEGASTGIETDVEVEAGTEAPTAAETPEPAAQEAPAAAE